MDEEDDENEIEANEGENDVQVQVKFNSLTKDELAVTSSSSSSSSSVDPSSHPPHKMRRIVLDEDEDDTEASIGTIEGDDDCEYFPDDNNTDTEAQAESSEKRIAVRSESFKETDAKIQEEAISAEFIVEKRSSSKREKLFERIGSSSGSSTTIRLAFDNDLSFFWSSATCQPYRQLL